MTDDERQDSPEEEAAAEQTPAPETPEAEAPAEEGQPEAAAEGQEPAAPADEPAAEAEEPAAEEEEPAAEAEEPAAEAEEPAAETEAPAPEAEAPEAPAGEAERPSRKERNPKKSDEAEAIPGAHLEPDLVLDEAAEADPYAVEGDEAEGGESAEEAAPEPISTTILELAADARYLSTGKRKSAVARVTIKPGTGTYTVNNKELNEFFPRPTLQRVVRGPLETVGQQERLDVVAKIHGGGVSSQAGALRHGIARALVEADPNLRGELKRRGFLTRDPRVKERKKAGLKKARKRPQFSKR